MLLVFLHRFLIFLFYYVGVTAFFVLIYFNYVIFVLEQSIATNSFPPSSPPIRSSYDIIIVGGGVAGLTIAAGLQSRNVLIIEAGNDFQLPKSPIARKLASTVNNIPIITPLLMHQDLFDWQYRTQPQAHACQSLTDHVSHWPMGKGFGGTQLINNMIYHRGHENDYRDWFDTPYYNYLTDILPYFLQFESFIELSDLRSKTKLADAFIHSESQSGFDDIDFRSYQRPKVMQHNGQRWSVADSYHSNYNYLHQVIVNAKVDRILFDDDAIDTKTLQPSTTTTTTTTTTRTLKAVGVSYRKYGRMHEVRATKAVILSSGTVGTPTILLKSGIGPENLYTHNVNKSHQDSSAQKPPLKIELRKHLPAVGENLQDHVTTGLDLIQLQIPLGMEPWSLYTFQNLFNYFWKGSGPFTMTGCEALGFIRTKNAHFNDTGILDNRPDLGFMVMPMGSTIDGGVYFRRALNINEQTWKEYFQPLIGQTTISILPIVLHPKSRGIVTIRLSSYDDEVIETIIQPNYLSHPDDVEVLVAGLKILMKLVQTAPFQSLGATIPNIKIPGCTQLEFGSDEYWRCYAKHLTLTAYHPVGTCRMGSSQNESVVDSQTFRVHGTEHLYICDASIMPTMPSANPQAAVGMLAKKFLHSFKKQLRESYL